MPSGLPSRKPRKSPSSPSLSSRTIATAWRWPCGSRWPSTSPASWCCRSSGYWGRAAIHELLVVDEPVREAILRGADASQLQEIARKSGLVTLYEDGLRKVATGVTSLEEVLRVTQDQTDG